MIKIDIKRIQKSLDSPTFQIPLGLTREEVRTLILSKAPKTNK